MPKLIKALLFFPIDQAASGSARFANGDWSQVGIIMPIVTKIIERGGWSTFVARTFMTLCERAGTAYPVRDFARQANVMLDDLPHARGAWSGTTLPANIAATVQRLADANFPLQRDDAQSLLRTLDTLIDLGDRRSAALEQTSAFKNLQRPAVEQAAR